MELGTFSMVISMVIAGASNVNKSVLVASDHTFNWMSTLCKVVILVMVLEDTGGSHRIDEVETHLLDLHGTFFDEPST